MGRITNFVAGLLIFIFVLAASAGQGEMDGLISSGNFRLVYQTAKWSSRKSGNNTFELTHVKTAAYVRVICGPSGASTDKLVDSALEQLRKADANLHVASREPKTVDGTAIVSLRVLAAPKGIPLTYWGYYYGGDAGTVQVLTYAGRASFERYEADLGELLDGLRIGQ